MTNTYTIYLGCAPIATVSGTEYAYEVYKKTAELAELLGKTASLVWDETGEEVVTSDPEEEDPTYETDEWDEEEDPEEEWEEPDWDDLESGFDPYEGCYTCDC